MSWSFSGDNIPKADLDHAIDEAAISGQDPGLPGMVEQVTAAKAALKLLGARCIKSHVAFTASGHALQPHEHKTHHDGITVSVTGIDPKRPA